MDMHELQVVSAEEAAQLLRDLEKTPQLIDLHFEFDAGVNKIPTVKYTVERMAYSGVI